MSAALDAVIVHMSQRGSKTIAFVFEDRSLWWGFIDEPAERKAKLTMCKRVARGETDVITLRDLGLPPGMKAKYNTPDVVCVWVAEDGLDTLVQAVENSFVRRN